MKRAAFDRDAWKRALMRSGLGPVRNGALLGFLTMANENGSGLFVPREWAEVLRLDPETFCSTVEQLRALKLVHCSAVVQYGLGTVSYLYRLRVRPSRAQLATIRGSEAKQAKTEKGSPRRKGAAHV